MDGGENLDSTPNRPADTPACSPIFATRRSTPPPPRPPSPSSGGAVSNGYPLVLTATAGHAVYYTLDGSDPREAWTSNAVGTPYRTGSSLPHRHRAGARAQRHRLVGVDRGAVPGGRAGRTRQPGGQRQTTTTRPGRGTRRNSFFELLNTSGQTIDLSMFASTAWTSPSPPPPCWAPDSASWWSRIVPLSKPSTAPAGTSRRIPERHRPLQQRRGSGPHRRQWHRVAILHLSHTRPFRRGRALPRAHRAQPGRGCH